MVAWGQTQTAPSPLPQPPEHDIEPPVRSSSPDYLGLILDEGNRRIRREGRAETVELASRELMWGLIKKLLRNRESYCSIEGLNADFRGRA